MRTLTPTLTLIALLFAAGLAAQCPGPVQRTLLINLQKSKLVESSLAGQIPLTDACGNLRYAQYTEVDLVPIGSTPTPTGNTSNYSEFVTDPAGDVYYIDWQGRSIRLRVNSTSIGDQDFLEIDNNGIPDNIRDSIYTRSYAAFGARHVWPGANVAVYDSTSAADVVIIGNRDARISVYNTLTGAWSGFNQSGATSQIYLGSGTTGFQITETSGTPTDPFSPFDPHFLVNTAADNIRMHKYPHTRRDAGAPNNVLGTDALGVVRSWAPEQIQGNVVEDYSGGAPNTDPTPYVVVDPNKGPFFARNIDGSNEIWQYNLETDAWEPYPLGGGGGGVAEPAGQVVYGTGTGVDSDASLIRDVGNNDLRILGSNGNLSVRTQDTTGVLSVKNNSEKVTVAAIGDHSSSATRRYYSAKPENVTLLPNLGSFNITGAVYQGVNAPFSTRPNYVYDIGYNVLPGAVRDNPLEPAFGVGFETYFQNASLRSGQTGFFEYHERVRDTAGVEHRFTSGVFPWDGKGGSDLGFNVDKLYFGDYHSGITWAHNNETNIWDFEDTTKMRFNERRGYSLSVRNGANDAMMDIMEFNNTDTLDFCENALSPATKVFNRLIIQQGTLYPRWELANINIGDNWRKSNLVINGSNDVPLTMRGGVSNRLWGFEISSGAFALRNLTDNTYPQYFYNDNGNFAFILRQNNVGFGGIPGNFPEARMHVYSPTGATAKLIALENTTGRTTLYRTNATPESAITANPGDMAFSNISAVGDLWVKRIGTGNTGWAKVITDQSSNFLDNIAVFSNTATARGLSIVADSLKLHAASYTLPGAVNVGAQTFAGPKTFQQGAASVVTPVIASNIFDEDGQGVGYSWLNGGTTEATIIASNPAGALVRNFAINVNNGTTLEPFYEVNGTNQTATFQNAIAYELENSGTTTWQATGRVSHINITSSTTTLTLPEIVAGAPGTNQVAPGFTLVISNDSGATVTINRSGSADTIGGSNSTTVANNAGLILKAMTADKWFVY